MSNSLQSHGLQHARLPCPSATPRACINSCPLSQYCHPSHPLLSPSPPAFNLSQHHGESALHSFNISPSNEYSGLMSFRIDWFDLLTVQGTLNSLFQHHRGTEHNSPRSPRTCWHKSFWGDLTNSCEKKRGKKQRRKGKDISI